MGLKPQNKISFMLRLGFVSKYCKHRKQVVYEYKDTGYSWTTEEIDNTPLSIIIKYTNWYDGKMTEQELDDYVRKCKEMSEKVKANKETLINALKCDSN